MANYRAFFLISTLILIFTGSTYTQANEGSEIDFQARLNGLDKLVEQTLNDFNIPGLAIAIVANGKVIKNTGYGFRDIEKSLSVSENTQFSIGSSTKAFTSFMLGTLVDDGKLNWDTPVKDILPEWQTIEAYVTENASIRDLLSHRTGLARHELIWLANPDLTASELLEKLPHLELGKQFRQGFIYNNLAYAVAGLMAEKVTGQDWGELVQTRILDTLGMANTTLERSSMLNFEDFALPYIEVDNTTLKLTQFNASLTGVMRPAGAINSSAKDMAKWLQVLVSNGDFNQEQVIQANTLANIQSPHTAISPFTGASDNSPMHYALGWFTRTYRGHYQVQHGGNDVGFTSAVFTYPGQKVGIVVLANKNASSVPYALSLDISDMLLGLEPRNYLANSLNRKKAAATPETKAGDHATRNNNERSVDLDNYVGIYHNPGYGEIEIKAVNGELELTYLNIKERFAGENKNTFRSVNSHYLGLFEGESLIFEQDKNGSVISVNAPFDFPTAIKFKREKAPKICFFLCTEEDFN